MRLLTRLLLSLVVALLLPFPGPHVDGYLPIAAVLFRRDALQAGMGFFILAAVVIAVYAGIVFAILTLIAFLRRRVKPRALS